MGNVDAAGAGGAIKGIYTASYVTLANVKSCLLVNNQAPATTLLNIAGNATGALAPTFASLGGNVTDETTSSARFLNAATDKWNNAALAASISPLAGNGGATKTHAISHGSPAQRSSAPSTLALDQRGAPRHQVADAGAFELIEPELSVMVAGNAASSNASVPFGSTLVGAPITKAVTITNTQTSSFTSGPLTLGSFVIPAGYSITGDPSVPLANGQSATFTITLAANSVGTFNGPLTFTSNDGAASASNPYSLSLTGFVNMSGPIEAWRQAWFGIGDNTGLAADGNDFDKDGTDNGTEFLAGTDPKSPASVFRPMATTAEGNFVISFSSEIGHRYTVESSESLTAGSWTPEGVPLVGTGNVMSVSIPMQASEAFRFYRIVPGL